MPRVGLTDAVVRKLKIPQRAPDGSNAQVDYYDALFREEGSLGLRVSSNGARSWFVTTRVLKSGLWKLSRVTLGRYPDVSLAEARAKAREAISTARKGKDPAAMPKAEQAAIEERSRNTFGRLGDEFLAKYVDRKLRKSTAQGYRRALKGATDGEVKGVDTALWQERPIDSITRRDIHNLLDLFVERGIPVAANRTLAYLKRFFSWVVERDILESAPTDHVRAPTADPKRDRALSRSELVEVWRAIEAVGGPTFGPLLKILILTGQREGEVAGMEWAELKELDGQHPLWELPGARTKNKHPHLVPLTPAVVRLIRSVPRIAESRFVFTATGSRPTRWFNHVAKRINTAIERTRRKAGAESLPHWQIHDLRRTFSTRMHEDLREQPHIVEAILNHVSGAKAGVAGTYNRALYLDDKRRALEGWAVYVEHLMNGDEEAGKIVPFRQAAPLART